MNLLKYFTVLIIFGVMTSGCTVKDPLAKREQWLAEATKGNVEAQYQLGKEYCCGYDIYRSANQAIHWFCQAALQGYGPAQYELGRFFALRSRSDGATAMRQELIQGYMWYSLAALQQVPLAVDERDALARDMNELEVSHAKRRLRNWKTSGGC